ncbi:hypothetical protein PENTCL1PPCAC_11837, partial [Pristionchus entomophagus]
MHIAIVVYCVYGGISLTTYLIVMIIILILQTKLCSSFSKLIMLYSIVNILSYLISWYSHRLRVEPIFWPVYQYLNTVDDLRNFLTFLMPLANYNQSVCNLLLTLNRFTAILWTKNIRWIIILAIFSGSVSSCSRLPLFTIWKFSDTDNYYFIKHRINLNAFWYQIGFCVLLLTICSLLNVISIVKLRKLGGSKTIKDAERSLFFVAICTFLEELANLFMLAGKQISQAYEFHELWMAFNVGSPYVTDVCSLGLPYYLILVKGPIRQTLLKFLNLSRETGQTPLVDKTKQLASSE